MTRASLLHPLFIIAAALAGLAIGHATPLGSFAGRLVEPALAAMLFFVFLPVDGLDLRRAFGSPQFTITALCVNFVWTPAIAYVLGALFLGESTDLRLGLLMLLATPCTDWYLVFTRLAGGNVALGASILPLNLLLQVLLLPLYVLLFFGGRIDAAVPALLAGALAVLAVPFAAAWLLRLAAGRGARAAGLRAGCEAIGGRAQLTLLCLAVLCMFAGQGQAVMADPLLLLKIFMPVAVFFAGNLAFVRRIGIRSGMSREDVIALNFTTLARNSPLALAIAVAAFPDRPLVALALVIGPLIELPVLGAVATVVRWVGDDSPAGGKQAPR